MRLRFSGFIFSRAILRIDVPDVGAGLSGFEQKMTLEFRYCRIVKSIVFSILG